MQHTGLTGDLMDSRVNVHGGWFNRVATGELFTFNINHDDVIGIDLFPQQSTRVQ